MGLEGTLVLNSIVNVNKIAVFHSVNIKMGHLLVEIRSPRELLHEEDL